MKAVAEASTESLKNTIQPQVEALWDAVKWMEDRMEAIDAQRRGELEDASRAAAQNTAKVKDPHEMTCPVFISWNRGALPEYCCVSCHALGNSLSIAEFLRMIHERGTEQLGTLCCSSPSWSRSRQISRPRCRQSNTCYFILLSIDSCYILSTISENLFNVVDLSASRLAKAAVTTYKRRCDKATSTTTITATSVMEPSKGGGREDGARANQACPGG